MMQAFSSSNVTFLKLWPNAKKENIMQIILCRYSYSFAGYAFQLCLCSGLKGRRPFWLLNPPSRGGS